jgi:hypothetical protein
MSVSPDTEPFMKGEWEATAVDVRTKREDRSVALDVIHAHRDAWRESSELLATANG